MQCLIWQCELKDDYCTWVLSYYAKIGVAFVFVCLLLF